MKNGNLKGEDDENGGDNQNDSPEGMSSDSGNETEQWKSVAMGNASDLFYDEIKDKNLTNEEKKQRARCICINKRVDELLEVLDQCIADSSSDSKALNKLKTSLKTVQHLSKITERER